MKKLVLGIVEDSKGAKVVSIGDKTGDVEKETKAAGLESLENDPQTRAYVLINPSRSRVRLGGPMVHFDPEEAPKEQTEEAPKEAPKEEPKEEPKEAPKKNRRKTKPQKAKVEGENDFE
jgi:outer membrane biosynthesis protein TonB